MLDDHYIPTFTYVTERDVDLLLVEELRCNRALLQRMATTAGLDGTIVGCEVLHSARRTQERREIDLHVVCHMDGQSLPDVLLIENKLTETEQPYQAESYLEECRVLVAGQQAAHARAIIVCPAPYAAQWPAFVGKFDGLVTYEQIAAWLAERASQMGGELATRLSHRVELLDQAVGKHRRGWVPKPVEEIGGFNARYIALLAEVAPEIVPGKGLSKGDAKPADSVSMIFDQAGAFADLPEHVRPRRFSHELGRGRDWRANYVAATFAGWAVGLAEHREQIEAELAGTPYEVHGKTPNAKRPNPGLVLSRRTPPVDNRDDFDAQIDELRQGIAAAQELRRWLIGNVALLDAWSKRLGSPQGAA